MSLGLTLEPAPPMESEQDTADAANGGLLGSYVRSGVRRGLSPVSLGRRLQTMRSLAAFIEPRNLLEATREDIEAWLGTRRQTATTRRWHLSNLASFFAWAVRQEWLDANPTARIDRPKSRRYLPRPIAEPDLELAIEAADVRTRLWLMLAAYQGLRVSEIAGLRREAVLDHDDPPKLLVERGKGGHQRVVPLNAKVQQALRDYEMPPRGWLFPGQGGVGHLTPETVTKYLSKFFRELDMPITAHQLRHYFASVLYQKTHDLRMVQELLGHASPATTAIYTAWSLDAAAEVVRGLGA